MSRMSKYRKQNGCLDLERMERDDMSDTSKNTGFLLGEMKKFLKLIMRIAAQAYEYTKNC